MPREHCADDAHQSCTYSSIVNIDQLYSKQQERTWTLARTMSQPNKRYQTAIENIRLTMPMTQFDRSSSAEQQTPTLLFNNSMRFLHVNGEFIVRI